MIPLGEFELHIVCPSDWNPPEAWAILVHSRCGSHLGDDFEMMNLESLIDRATAHVCKGGTG
jgi:hypothetical protein